MNIVILVQTFYISFIYLNHRYEAHSCSLRSRFGSQRSSEWPPVLHLPRNLTDVMLRPLLNTINAVDTKELRANAMPVKFPYRQPLHRTLTRRPPTRLGLRGSKSLLLPVSTSASVVLHNFHSQCPNQVLEASRGSNDYWRFITVSYSQNK